MNSLRNLSYNAFNLLIILFCGVLSENLQITKNCGSEFKGFGLVFNGTLSKRTQAPW